ncbi:MAG: ROK family transcriptional regulator [Clostridiales bacterium]|jgi:predicted NBD/HSP70 family sugar kinase|nr:ROK family transcriptional regulator [Clostridiales bacterium]
MQKGKRQSVARELNLSLIMDSFRLSPMSRADIARTFKLSKPTASHIASELESMGLITPCKSFSYNAPGVIPQKYEINPDLGLLATLDLSSSEVKISVSAFNGDLLQETRIPNVEIIRGETLVSFCRELDDLVSACNGLPLLTVCVAMPCGINKNTGRPIWSPRFEIDPDFDLVGILNEHQPGAAVILKNDVHLCMSAERSKNGLIDGNTQYAILVYADTGIGGSFFINGHVEDGFAGLAGEIGYFPTLVDGRVVPLDSAVSVNAIKKRLNAAILEGKLQAPPKKDGFHFADIKQAYLTGTEKQVTDAVNESAKILSEAIVSLIRIFDIYLIILNGRAIQFGENYLKIIQNNVKKECPEAGVNFSRLGPNAIRAGSKLTGMDAVIREKIRNREKQ